MYGLGSSTWRAPRPRHCTGGEAFIVGRLPARTIALLSVEPFVNSVELL